MCSLGSVWYITNGCGSYPVLPYPARPYPIYHSPSLCIPSIRSQDIEQKRSWNHGLPENSLPPYIVCGGIIRPKRLTAEIALLARLTRGYILMKFCITIDIDKI